MSSPMRPYKKTLIASLLLPLLLNLTACNDDDNKSGNNTSNNSKAPVMDCAPTK